MGQQRKRLPLQIERKWPLRSETTLGQKNVAHCAVGSKATIYLPTLHIKLGLIKISVKEMDK
jgi:hypothetical protein